MKIRASIWQVSWRYLLFAIAMGVIVFGSFFFTIYMKTDEQGRVVFAEWGFTQYMFTIFVPLVLIFFYFFSTFTYFYVIDNKSFTMKRMGKEYEFEYKNIEFIDIETSRKKHQVIFYAPKCRTRYLIGDKDGVLLETLIKKCPNTLTIEEFRRKHPEERY